MGSANGGLRRDPYFVGRAEFLDPIAEAATSPDPLLVYDLTGPGGIGKTTLLTECAARLSESKGCRVLQVGLERLEPGPTDAGRAADDALSVREENLAAYRRILEGLAAQLPGGDEPSFSMRARELTDVSPTVTALSLAKDRLQDAFVEEVSKSPGDRTAVLIDDFSGVVNGEIGGWLMDLVANLSKKSPTVVVVTRTGSPDEHPAFPGHVVAKPLTPFSREEIARYLELRAEGKPLAPGWAEAIDRWCGGYPLPVALAGAVAMQRPDNPEALTSDTLPLELQAGSAEIFASIMGSTRNEAERAAIEIGSVVRRFDDELLRSLLPYSGFKPAPVDIEERLARYPFTETLAAEGEDHSAYGFRPFVRDMLEPELKKRAGRKSASMNRWAEINSHALSYYEQKIDEVARSRGACYHSYERFEQSGDQALLLEFLHHAAAMERREARYSFSLVYFDAFWWWGAYIESKFCSRLIEEWEATQPAADRAFLDLVRRSQEAYPPYLDHYYGRKQGDPKALETALDEIRGQIGLDGDVGRMMGQERHVRALLDVFMAQARLAQRPDDAEAEGLQTEAIDLFRQSDEGEDEWCVPWVLFDRASARLESDRPAEAEGVATEALGLAAADSITEQDRDWEVIANLHRVLGDVWWRRKKWARAFEEYGDAVFFAYVFQGKPEPADHYTKSFYEEMIDRFTNRIAELLPVDRKTVVQACTRSSEFWEPYWEDAGRPAEPADLERLLSSGSKDELAGALFPPPPGEDELEHDSEYVQRVRRLHERLGQGKGRGTKAKAAPSLWGRARGLVGGGTD